MTNVPSGGRPSRVPADLKLTQRQKELMFSLGIADGCFVKQSTNRHARMSISTSEKNLPYLDHVIAEGNPWFSKRVQTTSKTAPIMDVYMPDGTLQRRENLYPGREAFTSHHAEFDQLYEWFITQNKVHQYEPRLRIIPQVSILKDQVSEYCLAHVLMQDGSLKSKESKGMEIHLQSGGYSGCARFSILLIEKFGIWAHPVEDKKRGWNVYISGHSYEKLYETVKEHFISHFEYKLPTPRVMPPRNTDISKINSNKNFYVHEKDNMLLREFIKTP